MSQIPQSKPCLIFISYRREDSQANVDRIYDRLTHTFGDDTIFKDVNALPDGYSFPGYINHVLGQCRVVLVVIGRIWATVLEKDGPYAGNPRLSNPNDMVRFEVERALALSPVNAAGQPTSNLLLIPLLVQGMQHMPQREQLPESLRPLIYRNARPIRDARDFDQDMQQLIATMVRWISGTGYSNAPPPAPLTTPIDALLAGLLTQMRDAFSAQDWPQVRRVANYFQKEIPAGRTPIEVYRMQGRALMALGDYAGAKAAWDTLWTRDPMDVAALRAAAEACIALGRQGKTGELAAALPLLRNAIIFTTDRSQRLAPLRILAYALTEVARTETGAAAQTRWNELLECANEGLRLATEIGQDDADWLAVRLEAWYALGQDRHALDIARMLTMRQNAPASLWLMRARLAWKLALETPTDEVRSALDAAVRLAPNSAEIATARIELLAILKPERFPPRLASLGFVANKHRGVAFITPPTCTVPAGEFLMREDMGRAITAGERLLHRASLAAYAISRFPVTVAEYACFVDAGQPQPPQWHNQLQHLDHPVVYVSWDDVVAYAAWLAQMTGQPWRLPTEAEWEKAAHWDARAEITRRYPWGDTYDQSRARLSEGVRGETTAVGRYPNGASLYGAEDMVGNVWEWTHSEYKAYAYILSDAQEMTDVADDREIHGGSWNYYDSANARMAFGGYRPVILSGMIGFRLALAPDSQNSTGG